MENLEDRTEELQTRPSGEEPTNSPDDEPTVPGTREPRGDESTGGQKSVQEYPGEGVRSHYPTDPATGREPGSGGVVSDDSSGDEGV